SWICHVAQIFTNIAESDQGISEGHEQKPEASTSRRRRYARRVCCPDPQSSPENAVAVARIRPLADQRSHVRRHMSALLRRSLAAPSCHAEASRVGGSHAQRRVTRHYLESPNRLDWKANGYGNRRTT